MKPTRTQHAPDLYDVWNATEVIAREHALLTHFTVKSTPEELQLIARARPLAQGWKGPVVYQACHRLRNDRQELPAKVLWSLLVDLYAQADRGVLGAAPGLVDEQRLMRRRGRKG